MDRNTLGRQALNEFQQYVSPYNNHKFTEEYTVQHLHRNTIDPAANAQRAIVEFKLPPDQEPTEEQIDKVERVAMAEALKPFHNPKLRKAILDVKAEIDQQTQVIDEVNKDTLLFAGQSQAAKDKAKTVLSNFRQFIEDNKDEIEALQILYSRPYQVGAAVSAGQRTGRGTENGRRWLHRWNGCGGPTSWSSRKRSKARAASNWSMSWPWCGMPWTRTRRWCPWA